MGRPSLTKEQVDEINDNLAVEESLILGEGIQPDNAVRDRGNYPIQVLTLALQTYGDCTVERVRQLPISPGFYLVGNGYHWQMVATSPNGRWVVCDDGCLFPVMDEHSFFRNRLDRRAVLRLTHPHLLQQDPASSSVFLQTFAAVASGMDYDAIQMNDIEGMPQQQPECRPP